MDITFRIIRIPILVIGILLIFGAVNAKDNDFKHSSISEKKEQITLKSSLIGEKILIIRQSSDEKYKFVTNVGQSQSFTSDTIFNGKNKKAQLTEKHLIIGVSNESVINSSVVDLKQNTDYSVDLYHKGVSGIEFKETFDFTTPVEVPKKNSFNILYRSTSDNEITIGFRTGFGEKHIVVASETAPVGAPANGTEYDSNQEFGKGSNLGNNSFVVYDGKDSNVVIKNLKPNRLYNFRIYDYNGSGKKRSYCVLEIGGNPSAKRTLLSTPINPKNLVINKEHFEPAWDKVSEADTYIIDVATDDKFTEKSILKDYKGIDVGDINQFYVEGLAKNKKYYWRVTAKNENNRSKPSEVVEVILKD